MKTIVGVLFTTFLLTACNQNTQIKESAYQSKLAGTWKLITGRLIEKGDTLLTDYTKGTAFIKIINATHFAFLQHDLTRGMDSTKNFQAGGGTYTLHDSLYTEHLQYCSARNWEGNSFPFTISIKNDTLTQKGLEEVKSEGIRRINIETYIRLK